MNKYFRQLSFIALALFLVSCTTNKPDTYNGMFYLNAHFVDARELFDDKLSPKPQYKDNVFTLFDFKKTDRIKIEFDQKLFVEDDSGRTPGNQSLYYPDNMLENRVSIKFDLDNVEVVELLDLQAKSGCLDHKPHPSNIAVSRFNPAKNIKEVSYTIKMPCRRYYSVPSYPYESVLMVKVKTSKDYYYTIYKLYSASRNECLDLWCRKSNY